MRRRVQGPGYRGGCAEVISHCAVCLIGRDLRAVEFRFCNWWPSTNPLERSGHWGVFPIQSAIGGICKVKEDEELRGGPFL